MFDKKSILAVSLFCKLFLFFSFTLKILIKSESMIWFCFA